MWIITQCFLLGIYGSFCQSISRRVMGGGKFKAISHYIHVWFSKFSSLFWFSVSDDSQRSHRFIQPVVPPHLNNTTCRPASLHLRTQGDFGWEIQGNSGPRNLDFLSSVQTTTRTYLWINWLAVGRTVKESMSEIYQGSVCFCILMSIFLFCFSSFVFLLLCFLSFLSFLAWVICSYIYLILILWPTHHTVSTSGRMDTTRYKLWGVQVWN